ncbi:hypothetical protein JOD67_003240 [Tenggerimyces flavus]|nr:hypothetical protein [Tenggerimyces flavus]
MSRWEKDYISAEILERVKKDMGEGESLNLQGTPS